MLATSPLAAFVVDVVASALGAIAIVPAAPATADIGPGDYRPLQPAEVNTTPIRVSRTPLDVTPVTNTDLLRFVRWHPEMRRDRIDRLLADDGYLARWAGPLELGPMAPPNAPVVEVSWFVARAYCASRGERLPTEAEWELAGAASPTKRDARGDPAWSAAILDWYGRPAPKPLPDVGRGVANAWGVRDMHTLVWEWVDDFGADLVSEDARANGDRSAARFCGAGALSAIDPSDYAAFMRVAMRSALRASDTTSTLGFRCAGRREEMAR
jgi:formylglycine-generating enzyme required for sulfatase activity